MFKKFNKWLGEDNPKNSKIACEHDGCFKTACYRAPKKNVIYRPIDYQENTHYKWHWFCLEHVRAYNKSWNFGNQDIEPLESSEPYAKYARHKIGNFSKLFLYKSSFKEPFGLFDDFQDTYHESVTGKYNQSPLALTIEQQNALKIFELSYPFQDDQLQKIYRKLVKKYHPDTNNGCKIAEEKIKNINQAYSILKVMLKNASYP